MWPLKRGSMQIKKKWPFNTGDYLIEVTACADLTVFVWYFSVIYDMFTLNARLNHKA
jgi:hypothetical protein